MINVITNQQVHIDKLTSENETLRRKKESLTTTLAEFEVPAQMHTFAMFVPRGYGTGLGGIFNVYSYFRGRGVKEGGRRPLVGCCGEGTQC